MRIPGKRWGAFRKLAGYFPGKMEIADFFRVNINGILGTVAFHLFIIVLFMFSKLNTANREYQQAFLIDFQEESPEINDPDANEQSGMLDHDYVSAEVRRNIAVSESDNRPVPDEFRDYSSEEMNDLNNRVDEILNNASKGDFPELDQPEIEFEEIEDFGEQYKGNENEEPYTGPTNIYYDLPGRRGLYVPVPVYKCPDGGIVTVNITVDNKGNVINAGIEGEPSDFSERCLHEEAFQAALGSRFSREPDAPPVQSGTITFHFQRQ